MTAVAKSRYSLTTGWENDGKGLLTRDYQCRVRRDVGYLHSQPIIIPTVMPTVNDVMTVSIGSRCRRLVVSSKNSSAASPPCFTTRLALL